MPTGLKRSLFALCGLAFAGMTIGILLFGTAGAPSGEEHELIKQLREFARPQEMGSRPESTLCLMGVRSMWIWNKADKQARVAVLMIAGTILVAGTYLITQV